jgi:hypothetical protein
MRPAAGSENVVVDASDVGAVGSWPEGLGTSALREHDIAARRAATMLTRR